MKKIFYILTAALLLTGALLTTGCTNDDTANDNNTAKTVTFTATLAPKGGASRDQSRACSSFGETQPALAEGKGGATTRAITTGTEGGKEVLTTAWAEGEKIGVYYQTGPDTYATAEANVDEVNDGVATISASLTNAMDGGTVKFVYPAYLMDQNGNLRFSYIVNGMGLCHQYGNLTGSNSISTGNGSNYSGGVCDLCIGNGTLAVDGSNVTVSSKVTMTNEVCICKFHFALDEGTGMGMGGGEHTFRTVTIDDGDGHIYTITSDRPDDQIGGATRGFKSTDDIYVAMLPIENKTVTFSYTETQSSGEVTYRSFKSNVTLEKGKFYRNLGTITMVKSNSVTLTSSTGELTLQNNDMLSGTGGANTRLKIAAGATVILNGVTNTGITQEANIPGIDCLGDATIILAGTNRVTGRWNAPGIFVPEGKTLTIKDSGTLYATGGSHGAGIGGTIDVSCGNIVIASGTVTATGTGECAGIGSGRANGANNTCGDITISGGTVTATGGDSGAGIGSGYAWGANNTCGDITISGGSVTATGGRYAAGIGSGDADQASNTCGDITISGGTVTATGGTYAAGIGSGKGHDYDPNGSGNPLYYPNFCGVISITGGTIEATSGDDGAGIGSGSYGRFASISIGSGITRVTATRSNDYFNVPIGKGFDDHGSGAVTFGGVTMHDGRNVYRNPSDWIYWPETGGPFGGIQVSASDYGSNNGRTWTLTPAP